MNHYLKLTLQENKQQICIKIEVYDRNLCANSRKVWIKIQYTYSLSTEIQ